MIQHLQRKEGMKVSKSKKFLAVDIIYILGMILPILCAIVLSVLTSPASNGVEITGALIYFTIPMPLQNFPVTEAQINSWLVIISIFFLCLYMTHGLKERPELKRPGSNPLYRPL